MRIALATLLAGFIASLVHANPLTGTVSTSVTVEQNDALLSSGELVLHVLRTDDLLSDFTPAHERSLILERLTHLVLRVRLDTDKETLEVNDAVLDLGALARAEATALEPSRVQAIRGEALLLPHASTVVEGHLLGSKQLAALADKVLPPGLVAAEVSIKEEGTLPVTVSADGDRDAMVSMRSYNVFVKITEVEHRAVSHETTLEVPILKVLLEYESQGKKVSMKAFALRPKADGRLLPSTSSGGRRPSMHHEHDRDEMDRDGERPHRHHDEQESDEERPRGYRHEQMESDDERPHRHGMHHGMQEDQEEQDHPGRFHTTVVDENEKSNEGRFQRRPHRPWPSSEGEEQEHHRHGPPPPPPFVRWIADLLGFRPPPHHHFHHGPPPPGGSERETEEKWMHRHHRHHPHSEDGDESVPRTVGEKDEFSSFSSDASPRPHSLHHHFGGHRHHRHFHGRQRRLACRIRFFFRHSGIFFLVSLLAKLALIGAVTFAAVRRVRKWRASRREGAVRLPDDEDVLVDEKGSPEEEAVEVVVDKA